LKKDFIILRYGRNDKVSVQYTNGKEEKDVKFKKVEDDIKNGKCEIIT
jgi:preprotein translocase subunit SecA